MQLGTVIGYATSTLKHPSLEGWRLSLVQPEGAGSKPTGDPVLAADKWHAGVGQRVVLNADGRAARELIGDDKSPVRWFIIGIVDQGN